MTETAKQAVAENADAQPSAGSEATDAQAGESFDLDAFLDSSNFNKGGEQEKARTEPSTQTADTDLVKVVKDLQEEVSQLRAESANRSFESEFDSAAKRLSEGLDVDLEAFKDALYGRVARDNRLAQAYENRNKNPEAWRQIEGALKSEFGKRFPAKSADIDVDTTQDREAIGAAVRGQASTASRGDEPSDEEIAKMSEQEFNDYMRKKGAPMFS